MKPAETPPPPPGPSLLAALGGMKPVTTRVPARAAAILTAVSLAIPVGLTWIRGPRDDLRALPLPWVVAMASLWIAALAVTVLTTTFPRRGDVLPDTARAARVAIAVAGGLILFGLVATIDAPGVTAIPEPTVRGFWRAFRHCALASLKSALPVMLVGGLLMQRLYPMGSRKIAASIGALGGVSAGLALHFVCGVGGGLHVGLAHGGGVVLGAAAGVLLLTRVVRQ